jgi:hypothetical protein
VERREKPMSDVPLGRGSMVRVFNPSPKKGTSVDANGRRRSEDGVSVTTFIALRENA